MWLTIFNLLLFTSNGLGLLLAEELKPEQVHLAIGDETSSITVTWVTQRPTPNSIVIYSSGVESQEANGFQVKFVDGGPEKREFYIHRVFLKSLKPNNIYHYICGSNAGWSQTFTFRVLPDHQNWSPRLVVFGDMGITNNVALPELIREVKEMDSFDVVLHVGDFAYNMDTDNARVGDTFMRQIEPIAAHVPYMTAVGNHEVAYNFSNYKARFSMPGGDGESQFYSFNLGPAHIIGFSSEVYYYLYHGWRPVVNQYEWLQKDLEEANRPENRRARPWIIVMAHRPMYCSNNDDPMHCDNVDNIVRIGFYYEENGTRGYYMGLEELFYKNGVDLIIAAHEHSYERFWPVYNRTVCNASAENPYVNPPAPVHIVTGSAGCSEGVDPFTPGGQPWSAFRSDEYGFTRMYILNGTHLTVEQVSAEQEHVGKVIDSFTVVNHNHGPNQFTCHVQVDFDNIPWTPLQPALELFR
ncbi:acid phosphatase type 7 [Paragonimus westermani]|uniref:Purple acid phosphatase n=1 Tax=Paragonimus westermani TaxID=34504 RepID=A0A5J4NZE9_9TREM|nr:acid phosphatase type 7 [Paragonimus westermani]